MYPHIRLRQQEMKDYIVYESCAPSEKLLGFSYTASNHTGRLSTSNSSRVFVIDKEGVRHNKMVIKNEHGYIIGRIIPYTGTEWDGLVDIEGKHFGYLISKKGCEIKICNIENGEVLLNCALPVSDTGNVLIDEDTAGISLGLCWYSYLQNS